MFEKSLESKLKAIFQVDKVTYDQPSENEEQECIFIEVDQSRNNVKDKRFIARVTGTLTIVGNSEKMPYGFFSKQIDKADPDLKRDLAFFNLERNSRVYRNIVQRTTDFTYFFVSQYDPNIGNITSLTINIEEIEE